MKQFVIYTADGKILSSGRCSDVNWGVTQKHAVESGNLIMKGTGNDYWNKVVNGKIVMRTSEEIEIDNPPQPFIPPNERRIRKIVIYEDEWDALLTRVEILESIIVP